MSINHAHSLTKKLIKKIMNENSLTNSKLLSIKDVCRILNISPTGVYRIVGSRKMPFYKIGHNLRFSEKDVINYLEENRVEQIQYRR